MAGSQIWKHATSGGITKVIRDGTILILREIRSLLIRIEGIKRKSWKAWVGDPDLDCFRDLASHSKLRKPARQTAAAPCHQRCFVIVHTLDMHGMDISIKSGIFPGDMISCSMHAEGIVGNPSIDQQYSSTLLVQARFISILVTEFSMKFPVGILS